MMRLAGATAPKGMSTMTASRHLVAATQPDPEQAPLAALPHLYGDLTKAVLSRLTVSGASGFTSPSPIREAVHDLLYYPDHHGHVGLVPGVVAMERVTRLALGDSLPAPEVEASAVRRACHYLSVQGDRLLNLGCWSSAASGELATIADEVLSRIDVERVRLEWEVSRRRAQQRIDEIDATVPVDATHQDELVVERDGCVQTCETSYIDFEGFLFDAVESRFTSCADPFEWYGFVVAESAWLVTAARSLLGLAEHSQRRLVDCPFSCGGWVGLSADPDVASCDTCGKQWSLSDGTADVAFAAYRSMGWAPRRIA